MLPIKVGNAVLDGLMILLVIKQFSVFILYGEKMCWMHGFSCVIQYPEFPSTNSLLLVLDMHSVNLGRFMNKNVSIFTRLQLRRGIKQNRLLFKDSVHLIY